MPENFPIFISSSTPMYVSCPTLRIWVSNIVNGNNIGCWCTLCKNLLLPKTELSSGVASRTFAWRTCLGGQSVSVRNDSQVATNNFGRKLGKEILAHFMLWRCSIRRNPIGCEANGRHWSRKERITSWSKQYWQHSSSPPGEAQRLLHWGCPPASCIWTLGDGMNLYYPKHFSFRLLSPHNPIF